MKYDVMIIGAGPGGYICAEKAAKLGLSVAIAEERDLGGTCLNRGCIPAKAMLHSADVYTAIKNGSKIGIQTAQTVLNIEDVFAYKNDVIGKLKSGIEELLKKNKITLFRSKARIEKDGSVTIWGEDGEETVECENIVIATGSKPSVVPIKGMELKGVLTSDELFQMNDKIPETMTIIGGGVISVEFAQCYAAFGTKITIIEAMPQILPMMDKEIARNMTMIMKKRGIEIHTGARVQEIEETAEGLLVKYEEKGETKESVAENVLVAVGRSANTQGLFGKDVIIETERGKIITDENFMTSTEHVYAIGDVTKSVQLAHVASAQGRAVAEILAKKQVTGDLKVIPSCVYTSPEIAEVGMTEKEAKEKQIVTKSGKAISSANGKSVISMEERGFIKLIFDAESRVLLGAQLMCARATDMIGELATAVVNKMTIEQLSLAMRAHPTVNEMIGEALENASEKFVS